MPIIILGVCLFVVLLKEEDPVCGGNPTIATFAPVPGEASMRLWVLSVRCFPAHTQQGRVLSGLIGLEPHSISISEIKPTRCSQGPHVFTHLKIQRTAGIPFPGAARYTDSTIPLGLEAFQGNWGTLLSSGSSV